MNFVKDHHGSKVTETKVHMDNNTQISSGNSVFHFIHTRKRSEATFPHRLLKPYVTRKLPEIFQAKEYDMGNIDKIFAAHWLDCSSVVYGTKCNKLCILNVHTGKSTNIPMIQGLIPADPDQNCGIHSIEMNASHTMLATGGESPNDLGIYKLPEFEPVCLGVSHSDWIFGIVWLTDHLVVTGSRDGCLGVWDSNYQDSCMDIDNSVTIKEPLSWLKSTYSDEKVRALQYNSLSMISSVDLPYQQENVCLSLEPDNSLYAVGSQSHVTLIDRRCPVKAFHSVESIDKDAGIRSLSFHDLLVTIGTGHGSCSFFDLRTYKFLHNSNQSICLLKAGNGWLRRDEVFYTLFGSMCFPNAIYTHCYDPSGSKLFTAGGPLAVGLYGNYAALWQ